METAKKLQLVTHAQAVKLQALGFDWVCRNYYDAHDCPVENPYHDRPMLGGERWLPAPTVALALKWMRCQDIENGVGCGGSADHEGEGIYYETFFRREDGRLHGKTWFDTYEEAESELLNDILTDLEDESKRDS